MGLFKSVFEKVKQGLAKTRAQFTGLRTILSGQRLSPQLIEEIERRLVQADVGIKTAVELRKDIQAGFERNEITTGDQALDFLKDQLSAYWPAADRRLKFADNGPTVIQIGRAHV